MTNPLQRTMPALMIKENTATAGTFTNGFEIFYY